MPRLELHQFAAKVCALPNDCQRAVANRQFTDIARGSAKNGSRCHQLGQVVKALDNRGAPEGWWANDAAVAQEEARE
jgi:hypothetical protein